MTTHLLTRIVAAFGLSAALGATPALAHSDHHVSAGFVAPRPMPPIPVHVRPAQPVQTAVWVPGTWTWTPVGWQWFDGYWATQTTYAPAQVVYRPAPVSYPAPYVQVRTPIAYASGRAPTPYATTVAHSRPVSHDPGRHRR